MAICRACSSEITGPDRYCRNCGALVAPVVAEFDDTRRFNPSAPLPAVPPGAPDTTNPLYAAPAAYYATPSGSSPSYQTASVVRKLLKQKLVWALIILTLVTCVGLGIGIGSSISAPDWREHAARDEVDQTVARYEYEEAVQNALGFKQGAFSSTEFPDAQGIFVNSLMSDDSAAALAGIQAGDLLTELNGQAVRNDTELSHALEPLETGQEVPVKVYRDGETISLKIRIADRSRPPFQPEVEPRDQGFLGILDSSRRPSVPGAKKWGVEIAEFHINGPAEIFGLRQGDVITEFAGYPVKTPNEFNRRIRSIKPRSKVSLTFYRGGVEQKIEVTLGRRW